MQKIFSFPWKGLQGFPIIGIRHPVSRTDRSGPGSIIRLEMPLVKTPICVKVYHDVSVEFSDDYNAFLGGFLFDVFPDHSLLISFAKLGIRCAVYLHNKRK